MRVVTEWAQDVASESHRLESEWTSLNEVWHDERAQNFYDEIIVPYQTALRALQVAISELGEEITEIGQIQ
ncbi:MAG: hypothetical protein M9953_13920 [Thermomicrobiales bacterium]|nr:hypothetical protein [Thermomicrobiales bacterium]MCO5227156.1 hypothetical protein [Thermomicrobiales bacterium]